MTDGEDDDATEMLTLSDTASGTSRSISPDFNFAVAIAIKNGLLKLMEETVVFWLFAMKPWLVLV